MPAVQILVPTWVSPANSIVKPTMIGLGGRVDGLDASIRRGIHNGSRRERDDPGCDAFRSRFHEPARGDCALRCGRRASQQWCRSIWQRIGSVFGRQRFSRVLKARSEGNLAARHVRTFSVVGPRTLLAIAAAAFEPAAPPAKRAPGRAASTRAARARRRARRYTAHLPTSAPCSDIAPASCRRRAGRSN